ncbi:glycosyltransferase [Desulfocurvibacter africanus]|uniref:Spore protein YkvP/CgeB glycosyl transferase-like domain-containing protein n=1 Tax=Desulfocurvibacter africanus subsp. africanus str. Walvis Bay TaxID=690850 RepID=F3Z0N0_DESAF|nr:glycosyltransferase [Desulfocurvibacter africanus]EGJ49854.1 hypothetical protein Desaf_1517 [Desulfocurvibacter africanus subsp. africanus str. Walvis Bay]
MERLRICLVSPYALQKPLEALGHEVLALHPKPGILDIAAELARKRFAPDLLVQVETLGPRVVLTGLPALRCPRLFWSVDTHLNLFWHRHYIRLFDGALTTQPHLVEELTAQGVPAFWLPWHGLERAWKPWDSRDLGVHFIGRMTEHRPARTWMIQHLTARFNASHHADLPYADMLATYERARIAPNEAICGEINFRLFETASCGCAVVTPDTDPGLAELFAPEREMLVFSDVLELDERIGFLLRNPTKAERMARAGWERVQACHLPQHRAARLLELAAGLPARTREPGRDEEAMVLTLHTLVRDGILNLRTDMLNALLAPLEQTPAVLQARFQLAAEHLGPAAVRALAGIVLTKVGAVEPEVLCAGSMAAEFLGEHELALSLWHRRLLDMGKQDAARLPKSPDPAGLAKAWAAELTRLGHCMEPGFRFALERHTPSTAHHCLLLALKHDVRDLEATRNLEMLLGRERGTEASRLSLLSHLCLHQPRDWRLGLRLALLNLKVHRHGPGLEELCAAQAAARSQGSEDRFLRMLAGLDSSGRALKLLLAAQAAGSRELQGNKADCF